MNHAPFEVHPPVHEAVEVLGDEAVVHGGVVDGVDYGRNDQLEFVKKYISIKWLGTIVSVSPRLGMQPPIKCNSSDYGDT